MGFAEIRPHGSRQSSLHTILAWSPGADESVPDTVLTDRLFTPGLLNKKGVIQTEKVSLVNVIVLIPDFHQGHLRGPDGPCQHARSTETVLDSTRDGKDLPP